MTKALEDTDGTRPRAAIPKHCRAGSESSMVKIRGWNLKDPTPYNKHTASAGCRAGGGTGNRKTVR